MDELTRSRYLQALGTAAYVSRSQLSGAAPTRRLAISARAPRPLPPVVPAVADGSGPASEIPVKLPRPRATPAVTAPQQLPSRPASTRMAPEFSLLVIDCGGWLWLEELEPAAEIPGQLALVQSLAQALGLVAPGPGEQASATRFDWPIHNNRQLDQGEEAARSSVAGFVQRKLDQLQSRGLILLGAGCEARLALTELDCPGVVRTVSTADMLQTPLLKRRAWRDLQPVCQPL